MNCGETDGGNPRPLGLCCVVGIGNPHRRDDGLGRYVVEAVRALVPGREDVRFLTRHQLEPDLAEDLDDADRVVFVDATVEHLADGCTWANVAARFEAPFVPHTVSPGFLVGLMKTVYHREPAAWLVSIQGDDFDFGEGISPEAEKRANRVIADLVKFVSKED